MNTKIITILFIFSLSFSINSFAQQRDLTLEDVINIAKEQSPDALIAQHQLRASYWEFKTYRRSLLPSLSFDGTIPSINRAFKAYTTSTGAEEYVDQSYTSYSGNLRLNKVIGLTGGNIFLSSGLQRVDNFYDSTMTNNYLSTPINLGFRQPLFNYNPYKWDKQIEPLKYQAAKRNYLETVEQVSLTAVNYFFNLLSAQIDQRVAQINVSNYDTLYKIAQGRYVSGKIAENDLLQLELNFLNSQSALENANLELENTTFRLKSFLRIQNDENIRLIIPQPKEFAKVEYELALEQAMNNSSDIIDFERLLLESRANVNQAKSENGFNANLYAVFGLMGNALTFGDAYVNPGDQQQLSISLEVPILDWGMRKGQVKMAESNADLVKTSVEQKRIDFSQNIFLLVSEYNMQQNQLVIAAKSDTVAAKSYNASKNRYLIGKISVTDLNIAQTEKDKATIAYIRALQTFWRNYFELRKITLYDFYQKEPLDVDFDQITAD
ncbi:MAG: TolC family protein [Bacteroidales bacterium]|jgi:outer membrane protein|nr:TolC family protein [Bacteroidales bacterium]